MLIACVMSLSSVLTACLLKVILSFMFSLSPRQYMTITKNSSQNHVLQGPSILTNTTICHMFWKTAEFLSETTQTLR